MDASKDLKDAAIRFPWPLTAQSLCQFSAILPLADGCKWAGHSMFRECILRQQNGREVAENLTLYSTLISTESSQNMSRRSGEFCVAEVGGVSLKGWSSSSGFTSLFWKTLILKTPIPPSSSPLVRDRVSVLDCALEGLDPCFESPSCQATYFCSAKQPEAAGPAPSPNVHQTPV